jgi:hypothetical protein
MFPWRIKHCQNASLAYSILVHFSENILHGLRNGLLQYGRDTTTDSYRWVIHIAQIRVVFIEIASEIK